MLQGIKEFPYKRLEIQSEGNYELWKELCW
jgi:hypothetical protein